MNRILLPALDGRTPLGLLAGLGLLRLLEQYTDDQPRLAWSNDDLTAILETTRESVDDIVADLQAIVRSIPEDGVLPATPWDMPPLSGPEGRFRIPPPDFRALAEDLIARGGPETEAWFGSLVTDLALKKGNTEISLYCAPSGQQSMRTMLDKPLQLVRENPRVLREALVSWRRYRGVSGEYLDHRVLFDGTDSTTGKSDERGVPGATWLAVMSYPLFRTTAQNREVVTSGWHLMGQYRDPMLILPVWEPAIDSQTAVSLIEHPTMAGAIDGTVSEAMKVLGIIAVCRAQRRHLPGRTFDGVLAPLT
jgi:hypothetical protein